MIKSQDVLVLLELLRDSDDRTVRSIGAALDLDPASVHRSVARLAQVRLLIPSLSQVNRPLATEFLVHVVKFVFPVELGGPTSGIPTAWGAEPLVGQLAPAREMPPVWPHVLGTVRGSALTPLHPAVPDIALAHPDLAEMLVLLDGIRIGDARIRSLSVKGIKDRLSQRPDTP